MGKGGREQQYKQNHMGNGHLLQENVVFDFDQDLTITITKNLDKLAEYV